MRRGLKHACNPLTQGRRPESITPSYLLAGKASGRVPPKSRAPAFLSACMSSLNWTQPASVAVVGHRRQAALVVSLPGTSGLGT